MYVINPVGSIGNSKWIMYRVPKTNLKYFLKSIENRKLQKKEKQKVDFAHQIGQLF